MITYIWDWKSFTKRVIFKEKQLLVCLFVFLVSLSLTFLFFFLFRVIGRCFFVIIVLIIEVTTTIEIVIINIFFRLLGQLNLTSGFYLNSDESSTLLKMKAVLGWLSSASIIVKQEFQFSLARISNCEIRYQVLQPPQGLFQHLISIVSPVLFVNLGTFISYFSFAMIFWSPGLVMYVYNFKSSTFNIFVTLDRKIPQDFASFIIQH